MSKNIGQLIIKIEKSRRTMHKLAATKGLNDKKVILISQQLDALLNHYYKETRKARGL